MTKRTPVAALLAAALLAATAQAALAETRLRVFVSSQHRPDVWRRVFDMYE